MILTNYNEVSILRPTFPGHSWVFHAKLYSSGMFVHTVMALVSIYLQNRTETFCSPGTGCAGDWTFVLYLGSLLAVLSMPSMYSCYHNGVPIPGCRS